MSIETDREQVDSEVHFHSPLITHSFQVYAHISAKDSHLTY